MKQKSNKVRSALEKTIQFVMNLDNESSARIPEWYDQMINNLKRIEENPGAGSLRMLNRLRFFLTIDFGSSVANYILRF